jgi:hypothetical protein
MNRHLSKERTHSAQPRSRADEHMLDGEDLIGKLEALSSGGDDTIKAWSCAL